ncbi:MAG: hypothetical protein NZ552_03800 [Planctomycetes bacterium]|nr:hypothetical protein [Planctomycetota bacterium]
MPQRPGARSERHTAYDFTEPGRATNPLQPLPERQDQIPTVRQEFPGGAEPVTEVVLPEDIDFFPEAAPPAVASAPPRAAPAAAGQRAAPAKRRSGPQASKGPRRQGAAPSARLRAAPERAARSANADSAARSVAQSLTTLLLIALGSLLVAVAAIALIVWLLHGRAERQAAEAALAEAERQQQRLAQALSQRRPDEAQAALAATRAALAAPELARPPYAERAQAVAAALREVEARIAQLALENAVAAHWERLRQRLTALSDPRTDLVALERDLAAFIANPVDPSSSPAPQQATAFAAAVGEARRGLLAIAAERERRQRDLALRVVHEARQALAPLLAEERFGEALQRIAEQQQRHPSVDLQPLIAQVTEAATTAWRVIEQRVALALRDAESPGATASQRRQALTNARQLLQRVVERFGVPEIVAEAQERLARLP